MWRDSALRSGVAVSYDVVAVNFHEDLKRAERIRGSSDRNFGFVFAAFLTFLIVWPLHRGGNVRWLALGLGAIFLVAALLRSESRTSGLATA
ncbi:MAG TPA: hypothetical protein VIH91_05530 [Terriglobales bacterium]